LQGVASNEGILLANLLQSSRSTFADASFPRFFAFKEGMWDTQISALWSSPTVSQQLTHKQGEETIEKMKPIPLDTS
jgi:hypothetical protein